MEKLCEGPMFPGGMMGHLLLLLLCVLGVAMCVGDRCVYWGQLCVSNRWSLFFILESYVRSVIIIIIIIII
jgi:hypothetical protein